MRNLEPASYDDLVELNHLSNKRITQLMAINKKLLAALEDVEWLLDIRDNERYCPCCGESKEDGHMTFCLVGKALKKARREG